MSIYNKITIFIFKLLFLISFTSEYSTSLFQPFVHTFTINNLNPWQYYLENNLNLEAFPYHSLMLFILYPFTVMGGENLDFHFLFKIPLLLADIGILYILLKLFPYKEKNIYLFYFLNPIIIFAIYIHSQLDIIPTALLFYGVYLLTIKRYNYSALIVGFALATKLHIIIAFPLIVFFLFKKESYKVVLTYILISFSTLLLLDLPFLFSDGFIQMVLLNPKQSLLFDSFYVIGAVKLLLPISAILMVYFHFFNQNKVNNDLIYFYFGLLFTVTIFFIYPGVAWYVWMIPYVSIYFIQNKNESKSLLLYYLFSLVYLIFFVFFYKSEYKDILFMGNEINLKFESEKLTNISFTFLEVTLLAIMYAFYKYGIKSNSIYKKQSNLIIGIGGDSGVGKTTLLDNLSLLLGDKLLKIEGDGEHKWERGDDNWNKFTHLDPKANHIHKQANAIHALKLNHPIYRSEYDHTTGKFAEAFKVEPKEFIAISGLHPFYLPKLRKNIDLKIYIDTNEDLRRHWKILRDTKKRGYSIEEILEQIDARVEDTLKYIYPQKAFADVVIEFFSIGELILGDSSQEVILGLKITVDADIYLEEMIETLECDYTWDYNEDLSTKFIILNDEPKNNFCLLANQYIPNINEIINNESRWLTGYNGFIQLVSLMMISEKLKEDDS